MKKRVVIIALIFFLGANIYAMMNGTDTPTLQSDESKKPPTDLKNLAQQKKEALRNSTDDTNNYCTVLNCVLKHWGNLQPQTSYAISPYFQRDKK